MRQRVRLTLAALPLAVLTAGPALAEVRALLVGVSDYHVLDADLKGPRNDVVLMAGALMARGADTTGIRILTTPGTELEPGLAPAEDPTRKAILDALDALAAAAGPEDTVIFYYSGHGSQAPDASGDEAGGYDEILLPSDAAGWKGAIGAVENAIVDDELQARMQAILDTGARLVAILDACHSATGFRDLAAEGVARYVSPLALGIPEAEAEGADGGHVAPPPSGDFVFLYSSQSDQRSFEYPVGDRDDPRNWYGDFTRNLAAILRDVPDLTWAQALAGAADGLRQEQASQTPDGEGPGLAEAVFGGAGGDARMRIEGGRLMAGLLAGLSEGAEIEVFAAAAGGSSLGTARLVGVTAADSGLAFPGALPATAYAELRSPGTPPRLRIAPAIAADGGDYRAAFALLDEIRAGGLVEGLDWTDAGYDLRLVAVGGEIAIVGRDGILDPEGPGSSPRIPADAGRDVVLGFIGRAVRLHRLQAVLAAAEGRRGGLGIGGVGLSVRGEVLAAGSDGAVCAAAAGGGKPLVDGASVSACDEIWLTVANTSRTAQDVTVLYVDRDMSIVPIWPYEGLSNRVSFGETAEIGLQVTAGGVTGGVEEIIVIAVPAREGAPRTVLTGLADPAAGRGAGDASDTAAWLMAAADPEGQSRDFRPGGRTDRVRVTRIRLTLAAAR